MVELHWAYGCLHPLGWTTYRLIISKRLLSEFPFEGLSPDLPEFQAMAQSVCHKFLEYCVLPQAARHAGAHSLHM